MDNILIYNPVYCNHIYKGGLKKGQTCGRFCRKILGDHKCGVHRARDLIKCPQNPQKGNRC